MFVNASLGLLKPLGGTFSYSIPLSRMHACFGTNWARFRKRLTNQTSSLYAASLTDASKYNSRGHSFQAIPLRGLAEYIKPSKNVLHSFILQRGSWLTCSTVQYTYTYPQKSSVVQAAPLIAISLWRARHKRKDLSLRKPPKA